MENGGCRYQINAFFHVMRWIFWSFSIFSAIVEGVLGVSCYKEEEARCGNELQHHKVRLYILQQMISIANAKFLH